MLLRTCVAIATSFLLVTAPRAAADGSIDASTLVSAPLGTFNNVAYTRYEAMFQGVTSNNRPYRVPCQIIAPSTPSQGSGLLLFDWLVVSTAFTIVGQEQADARYIMKDSFLFNQGLSYATVRCDPFCIDKESPFIDPTRPWSDNLLDTSSEFIQSAGDEYDIVVDYNWALRTDPVSVAILGQVNRRGAFGYSASGSRLRGLVRLQMGVGLFDFTVVAGNVGGYSHPTGNGVGHSKAEKPPLPGAGLEIDIQSETDALNGGFKACHEEPNYRLYQFAGTAHLRDIDCVEFGLADPLTANNAEWTPFFRALFIAAKNWSNGISPPPTIWLTTANDRTIARDAKGNALVRFVGGQSYSGTGFRLPEVAVGQNQYIPFATSYNDGTFLGTFRSIGGSHIDLTHTFTNHAAYVADVTFHARGLQGAGYLLQADADAIIQQAEQSSIGR